MQQMMGASAFNGNIAGHHADVVAPGTGTPGLKNFSDTRGLSGAVANLRAAPMRHRREVRERARSSVTRSPWGFAAITWLPDLHQGFT